MIEPRKYVNSGPRCPVPNRRSIGEQRSDALEEFGIVSAEACGEIDARKIDEQRESDGLIEGHGRLLRNPRLRGTFLQAAAPRNNNGREATRTDVVLEAHPACPEL